MNEILPSPVLKFTCILCYRNEKMLIPYSHIHVYAYLPVQLVIFFIPNYKQFIMLSYRVFPLHNYVIVVFPFHHYLQISRMTESGLGDTPTLLRPLVRELLAIEPSVRPDALQILKVDYLVCE